MPKYAPISYVVQKARERPKKKSTTAGSRTAKQGYATPTRGNENTAGLGQVTKTGQAETAQQKNATTTNFSAWLRKWIQLNQWLEGQGGTPTQARKHMCSPKVEQPEKSGYHTDTSTRTYVLFKSVTTRKVKANNRHLETN